MIDAVLTPQALYGKVVAATPTLTMNYQPSYLRSGDEMRRPMTVACRPRLHQPKSPGK
jgi:hypothetical protein